MIRPTPVKLNSELFILNYKESQGGRQNKLLKFLGDMSHASALSGDKKREEVCFNKCLIKTKAPKLGVTKIVFIKNGFQGMLNIF